MTYWIALTLFGLATPSVWILLPEYPWVTWILAGLFVGTLGLIIYQYRLKLKGRALTYTIHSVVTSILVLAILSGINFLASRYPMEKDFTRGKVNELSEQTIKIVKGLKNPVGAVFFTKDEYREEYRRLLERFKKINPKFELELVDANKQLTRVQQSGIKVINTLVLTTEKGGSRIEQRIEDPTEEKITNTLIKMLKDRLPKVCMITGHGERSTTDSEAMSADGIKKALIEQSTEVSELNLSSAETKDGKIPASCDVIAILGAQRPYLPNEIKLVSEYLKAGGKALIAIDVNVKGSEFSPEIIGLLKEWKIESPLGLVVDEFAGRLSGDMAMPAMSTFARDHSITKDFRVNTPAVFPLPRMLKSPDEPAEGITYTALVQSSPQAFLATDFKSLAGGRAARNANTKTGPFSVAIAVEGKIDPAAKTATRMVVFGSSLIAANQFGRYGINSDLVMNSLGWLNHEDNLISIRPKEEANDRIELSSKMGGFIPLLTVFVIPLLIAIGGIVAWVIRRKL